MKAYFIDFENVKSKGLSGIEYLNSNDKIIIFYSENSDTISFDMHRKVINSPADIEYLKVKVGGKNALDFQLSSLLGYFLASNIYSHIFVVSNDKGFDKLHDFWNNTLSDKTSCIVFRTQTISDAVNMYKENENTQNNNAPEKISSSNETKSMPNKIVKQNNEILNTYDIPADNNNNKSASNKKNRQPKSADSVIRNSLLGLFDFSQEEISSIKSCVEKSNDNESFYKQLEINFNQQSNNIYKILRPKYNNIKKLITPEQKTNITDLSDNKKSVIEKNTTDNDKMILLLKDLIGNICSTDEIKKIKQIICNCDSKKKLYYSIVKNYKKDRGSEIYKLIKNEYNSLEKLSVSDTQEDFI